MRCFSYREFYRLWSQVVLYICIIPPEVCQDNASLILRAANLSEDEKTQRLINGQHHLEFAKMQRQYYRDQVKVAGNPVFSRSTNLESKLMEFFVFVNL